MAPRAMLSVLLWSSLHVGAWAAPRTQSTPREFLLDCRPEGVANATAQLMRWGDIGLDESLGLLLRDRFPASEAGRQAAKHALARQWPAVRERLHFRDEPTPDAEVLTRAMELIGALGSRAEFALVCELALRFPRGLEELADVDSRERSATPETVAPSERALPTLGKQPLLDTMIALLQRDPEVLPRVAEIEASCPPVCAPVVLKAFADCARRDAFERLAEHLSSAPERTPETLNALSRAARRLAAPHDERLRGSVRARLQHSESPGFREAILCVGWLEDEDSAERLVELLRDPVQGVRADALWSLNRICGVRFAPDVAKWTTWLQNERTWRADRLPGLLDQLTSGRPIETAAALNEIVRHRFPRHLLAEALAARLMQLEGRAFESACETLAKLGSAAALPWLAKLAERDGIEGEALERCRSLLSGALTH